MMNILVYYLTNLKRVQDRMAFEIIGEVKPTEVHFKSCQSVPDSLLPDSAGAATFLPVSPLNVPKKRVEVYWNIPVSPSEGPLLECVLTRHKFTHQSVGTMWRNYASDVHIPIMARPWHKFTNLYTDRQTGKVDLCYMLGPELPPGVEVT